MNVNVKWYFDTISDIDNDITVAIGIGVGGLYPSLVHVLSGKCWDVARELEKIS